MNTRPKRSLLNNSSASSSGFVPPKRKHVKLPLDQKLSALERLEKGESAARLAAEFGIGIRTVYDLRKHKDDLLRISSFQEAFKDTKKIETKTLQNSSSPLVDSATYEWFRQCHELNKNVSGPMIMAKAKFFHKQMNIPDCCEYNTGWLTSFKNRHNIWALELSGECVSANTGYADTYITNFPKDTTNHTSSEVDYAQCIGGTMTTMARVAHEVREMYLSKFKKMSPYTCNAMSPRVLLLRLSPKVIEKYTSQHKGKSDQYFSDEEEDWALSATDDWANDDQDWNMTLLEPIVQISDESSSREVSSRNHGGIVSPKKKGRHLPLVPGIDRRKSPIDDIPIKQESPEPMEEISPDVSEGILPSSSPYAPTLPMFQVPSAILPVYMAQPPSAHPSPSFSQSQSSPGLPNPSFSQHPSAPVHPSHSFPLSNNEDLYTGSNHQTSSTRTQKSPEQAGKETYFDKDNIEANIKQEMPDEVIVMPFESDLHSDEPMAMPVEVVCASPLPAVGDFSTSEDSSVQEYPNGKSSEVFDDHLVSTCHRSLKELTRLLLELNNKNLMCDEKIQKLKEEYDKKVAVIETEKKANEKEIDRVLSLIQNWKEGPKGDASLST
ncbi:uncharacterized protein [Panulirus ornatus]|uniref:uncharacterized protein isoform X1 n=1 Tax=Panulirus ornatus TaxID=150431 RepID=UPI003A84B710